MLKELKISGETCERLFPRTCTLLKLSYRNCGNNAAIQGDIACEISASVIGFGVPVNRGVGESKVDGDASETAAHIIQDEGVSSRLRRGSRSSHYICPSL